MPEIKKLPSGYWLVRWNKHRWFQWPSYREVRLDDGFGWVTQQHLQEASKLTSEQDARTD